MVPPERNDWLTLLRELPKIRDLNAEDLDGIVASGTFAVYSPGEEIELPAQMEVEYHVVVAGQVRVQVSTPDPWREEIARFEIGAGSLMPDLPRQHGRDGSAVDYRASAGGHGATVCTLATADFMRLFSGSAEFMRYVFTEFGTHRQQLLKVFLSAVEERERRDAEAIAQLEAAGGPKLIFVTREELADLVGASVEEVEGEIDTLLRLGILAENPKESGVFLLHPQRLANRMRSESPLRDLQRDDDDE